MAPSRGTRETSSSSAGSLWLVTKANPRYIVTNLSDNPQWLYEQGYCARGERENAIKQQQLDLFADRTRCHGWWANPFRMILSSLAYILRERLRSLALKQTTPGPCLCRHDPTETAEDRGGGDPQHPTHPFPVRPRHAASGVVHNGGRPARAGLIDPVLSLSHTTDRPGCRSAENRPFTPSLPPIGHRGLPIVRFCLTAQAVSL